MTRLQDVALGNTPADLVIQNASVLLPETGDQHDRAIAIVGDRIAALPADSGSVVGPDTTVVDATGQVAVPGFIDAHTHIEAQHAFEYAYPSVLEGGTTSVVTEVTGMGPMYGAEGVSELLSATDGLPVSVFATLTPQPLVNTFSPAWADDAEKDALTALLSHPSVVGVGEVDWIHVVGRDPPLFDLYERAREAGKPISGHGAGCKGTNLQAFASVIDNDHEAISGDEVIERLENGIHVIGRSGTIRDDTAAIADAYQEVGAADLSLSTDSLWPDDLQAGTCMDRVVRRAIEAGVSPEDAVRMATLNPARHFGFRDRGTLSPGARADVVLLSDLESVAVETVISGGEFVVENGDATVSPRPHDYPAHFYDSVGLPDSLDLSVPATVTRGGRVRAIEYVTGLFSRMATVEPAEAEGTLRAAPERDVLKVVAIDRHPDSDHEAFVGFLTGFGLGSGAVATTTVWEAGMTVAVGATDEAIQQAIAHVAKIGGGWAVVDEGEIIAEHRCRVAGVVADVPIEEAAAGVRAVREALWERGVEADQPMLAVATLTFLGVPTLKLTPHGYADVLAQELVGLTPDAQ
ncbi:adenine deaminase C-terminal domain-containing protein [Haladaptatus sp. GCM10025707]|uniref:adenine deaminase C-terminal domain-containing protein n=1 Tax=unclassified Haladaptatus TaxID=2622732 RepID=UPI0023E87251|nr:MULTISPECIES: adenine deaminase C-terminal domain-containing protein [unclassified Haladaptatus]